MSTEPGDSRAVADEDPNAGIIRDFIEEFQVLMKMVQTTSGQPRIGITAENSESEELTKESSWSRIEISELVQHEPKQVKSDISDQASGIQVDKNKYYLMNFNDDISLDALLVYYLKDVTRVGGRSATTKQDIELPGLDILPEHCVITIAESGLCMTPLNDARCFVNQRQVDSTTSLKHGDFILLGKQHCFRVFYPRRAIADRRPSFKIERRSLADRWSDVMSRIELWVEIQELNEQGEYAPVEVVTEPDALAGGVYQLRPDKKAQVQVRIKPVENSGGLPIICQSISSIAIGGVSVRRREQAPLNSYQDMDLSVLRKKWSDAHARRQQCINQKIQELVNKRDRTEKETQREWNLVVSLIEERSAVLVPAVGSGIPGAPADWNPPPGMEKDIPVLFLDLNGKEVSVIGMNSILDGELEHKFYSLPIHQHFQEATSVSATALWDSRIDDLCFKSLTDANEKVYLILVTTVRLFQPAPMHLVLRKRLAINVNRPRGVIARLFKRGPRANCLTESGVTYEVVANIPKMSQEVEDCQSLAQDAASEEDGDPDRSSCNSD